MADTGGDDISRIIGALKRARPAGIVVVTHDDDEVHVALSGGQKGRWERVAKSILSVKGAATAQLRNVDGAIVDVVTVSTEEEETPTLKAKGADAQMMLVATLARDIVKVALDAQDKALARHTEVMRAVSDAAVANMKAASARSEALERAVSRLTNAKLRELDETIESMNERGLPQGETPDPIADEMAKTLMGLMVTGGKVG